MINLCNRFYCFFFAVAINADPQFDKNNSESLTPDDDVFRFLAKLYAKVHPTMHKGKNCGDDIEFKDGITNGAAWYEVKG